MQRNNFVLFTFAIVQFSSFWKVKVVSTLVVYLLVVYCLLSVVTCALLAVECTLLNVAMWSMKKCLVLLRMCTQLLTEEWRSPRKKTVQHQGQFTTTDLSVWFTFKKELHHQLTGLYPSGYRKCVVHSKTMIHRFVSRVTDLHYGRVIIPLRLSFSKYQENKRNSVLFLHL